MPPPSPDVERRRVASFRPPGRAGALVALLLLAACASPRGAPRPDHLAHGERLLAVGDERGAAAAYEAHLAPGDGVAGGDLALLRLALLRLEPGGSLYAPAAGVSLLRRLLEVHPESPFAPAAALILDLRRDNRRLGAELTRLREQLEELRRIDLGPGEEIPD